MPYLVNNYDANAQLNDLVYGGSDVPPPDPAPDPAAQQPAGYRPPDEYSSQGLGTLPAAPPDQSYGPPPDQGYGAQMAGANAPPEASLPPATAPPEAAATSPTPYLGVEGQVAQSQTYGGSLSDPYGTQTFRPAPATSPYNYDAAEPYGGGGAIPSTIPGPYPVIPAPQRLGPPSPGDLLGSAASALTGTQDAQARGTAPPSYPGREPNAPPGAGEFDAFHPAAAPSTAPPQPATAPPSGQGDGVLDHAGNIIPAITGFFSGGLAGPKAGADAAANARSVQDVLGGMLLPTDQKPTSVGGQAGAQVDKTVAPAVESALRQLAHGVVGAPAPAAAVAPPLLAGAQTLAPTASPYAFGGPATLPPSYVGRESGAPPGAGEFDAFHRGIAAAAPDMFANAQTTVPPSSPFGGFGVQAPAVPAPAVAGQEPTAPGQPPAASGQQTAARPGEPPKPAPGSYYLTDGYGNVTPAGRLDRNGHPAGVGPIADPAHMDPTTGMPPPGTVYSVSMIVPDPADPTNGKIRGNVLADATALTTLAKRGYPLGTLSEDEVIAMQKDGAVPDTQAWHDAMVGKLMLIPPAWVKYVGNPDGTSPVTYTDAGGAPTTTAPVTTSAPSSGSTSPYVPYTRAPYVPYTHSYSSGGGSSSGSSGYSHPSSSSYSHPSSSSSSHSSGSSSSGHASTMPGGSSGSSSGFDNPIFDRFFASKGGQRLAYLRSKKGRVTTNSRTTSSGTAKVAFPGQTAATLPPQAAAALAAARAKAAAATKSAAARKP